MFAAFGPRRIALGSRLLVFRWDDVADILEHDGDFLIAPVNAKRIENVSGPFILGMDRSEELFAQRRIVYDALRADCAPLRQILATEPRRILASAAVSTGQIDVVNSYARVGAARVAAALFGIRGPSEHDLMRVARAVFHETFLNLGGDEAVTRAGIAAGQELLQWIATERDARMRGGIVGNDVLGRLLAAEMNDFITPNEAGNILAGLLVGAIDTTATATANIVVEVLTDRGLALGIKRDLEDAIRLRGWCWEALRRRPHNPLLLRRASAGAIAAGGPVPKDAQVFALTFSAMQDWRAFPSPTRMDPERPEQLYMHFGHGMHLCAGRSINAMQIPILIATLLRHFPTEPSSVKYRGPFPDELVVKLRQG